MHRFLLILLMLSLPLQSFAQQWQRANTPAGNQLAHEMAHDGQVPHHHEADGSIHFDGSEESVKHLHDHSGSPQPTGLVMHLTAIAPAELVVGAAPESMAYVPDPVLDDPLRPPLPALG